MAEPQQDPKPREPRDIQIDLGPGISVEIDKFLAESDGVFNKQAARDRVRKFAQRIAVEAVAGHVAEIIQTGSRIAIPMGRIQSLGATLVRGNGSKRKGLGKTVEQAALEAAPVAPVFGVPR